jgi:hypothetical protein
MNVFKYRSATQPDRHAHLAVGERKVQLPPGRLATATKGPGQERSRMAASL